MLKRTKLATACFIFTLGTSGTVFADNPYEFDWKSGKDMSGAFFMCGLTAFTWTDGANCPKVLLKCMTDPSLLKWTWKGPKSKCLNLFNFFTSGDDALAALEEAASRSESDVDDHALANFAAQASGVEESVDQEPFPDGGEWEGYIEGSYSDTVYKYAEQATSTFVDSDYFNFYYTGDGKGGGGWGHPDYQRDHFEDNIYEGTTAAQAYDNGYNASYVEPDYAEHVLYEPSAEELIEITEEMTEEEIAAAEEANADVVALYEEKTATENAEIDEANDLLRESAIATAISGAIAARNAQQVIIDNQYDSWRGGQPWNTFGYQLASFETNYNVARTQAFYTAFVNAGSVPGCDVACATVAAEEAADQYSVFG